MALSDYAKVIRQAAGLGTNQVALGGGNPNEHPDFAEILRLTRQDYGIVPNFTTNGHGLSSCVLKASAQHCGAVAVSAYEPFSFVADTVTKLRDHGIRTNVHFVLDSKTVETALAWLHDPPEFMNQVNAIIFLNYKPVGRGSSYSRLLHLASAHQNLVRAASSPGRSFKVGFDSCMVSALVTSGKINPVWFDACEAARFSMFVSEHLEVFPCSFMETIHAGIPLTDNNMMEVWQNGKSFRAIRRTLRNSTCPSCDMHPTCRGGCPVFPEINLCSRTAT